MCEVDFETESELQNHVCWGWQPAWTPDGSWEWVPPEFPESESEEDVAVGVTCPICKAFFRSTNALDMVCSRPFEPLDRPKPD